MEAAWRHRVRHALRHLAQPSVSEGSTVNPSAGTKRPHNASLTPFAPTASGFLATCDIRRRPWVSGTCQLISGEFHSALPGAQGSVYRFRFAGNRGI